MKFLLAMIAALAAAATPGAADARRGVTPRAALAVHELARCLFVAEPDRVRSVLTMSPSDARYASTFQHLIERNACLTTGALSANDRVLKGALAEFALLGDLRGQPLAPRVADDPALPPILVADESEVMSICVVRAVPEQVQALFQTEPSSRSETSTLQAIAPALPGCLRSGARAELDRSSLRAMLASAAFRLTERSNPAVEADGAAAAH